MIQKVTCSQFRANTEPLFFEIQILYVNDINGYIIGT